MTVVFAYIPVVHKQVLEFLNCHKDNPIWLLDNNEGAKENVYLERDARALPAGEIAIELKAHGFSDVKVVSPSELAEIANGVEEIVIPEDEILRFFIDKYIPEVKVTAENIFIRWTQKLSTTEFEVPADRTISTAEFHQTVMKNLAEEAEKSPDWWRQISAAIVKDGEVITVTHNTHLPTAQSLNINGDPRSNLDAGQGPGIYTSIHAEAKAIAECARKGVSTEGADVYVTTFPCPTCARSIIEAGFKRVFYQKGYSVLDAEEILKGARVKIVLVKD